MLSPRFLLENPPSAANGGIRYANVNFNHSLL